MAASPQLVRKVHLARQHVAAGDATTEAQLRADAAMLLDGLTVDRDEAVRAVRSADARVGTAAAAAPGQLAAGQQAAVLSESTPALGPYALSLIRP